MKKRIILREDAQKEIQLDREISLKNRLIRFLRTGRLRDPKTKKILKQYPPHAKYAERLNDFDVKIVPLNKKPQTAAISFDEGVIYINEGFLLNPSTFGQLNVLMRHELAHYLMNHQLRMMHNIVEKYGEKGWTHISMSNSLHELMNIIEDFEISNERYTDEDKITVKNMMWNGQLIGGLITEEHEKDWVELPLGEMWKRLLANIEHLHETIIAIWENKSSGSNISDTYMNRNIVNTYIYSNWQGKANIFSTLDVYLKNKSLYHFFPCDEEDENGNLIPCMVVYDSLLEPWQEIMKQLYEEFQNNSERVYKKQQIRDLIKEIAQTNPTKVYELKSPITGEIVTTLYTPEEKLIALDSLKVIIPTLEKRETWYQKTLRAMNDCSEEDIDKAIAALEKKKK